METEHLLEVSTHDFAVEYEDEKFMPKRQRFARPKVCDSSFWSNENISKLIAAIKNYPAIWQTDSEAFKSRTQREAAWEKVAESFGNEIIDPNQLVAKWQNLRTQYRAVRLAYKKYAATKIGKRPSWRFYAQMVFIDNGETFESNESDTETAVTKSKRTREQLRKVVDSSFWNDENVLKLISAVKKRKSIWNFNDKNYKHRAVREADWQTIDNTFKQRVPVNQLAAKWQNLRTTYRSTKNTAKKLKEEHGLERTPNWKYYEYMNFLDECEEPPKCKLEADDIEVLEDVDSNSASEEYALDEANNEASIQSDFENNTVKAEDDMEVNDEAVGDPLQKTEIDNVEVFGNFFVSELKRIKSQSYLEATQRKILQFLWQCIDEEPDAPKN